MEDRRFSPAHLPYYTKLILTTLLSPVILYLVLVGNLLLICCLIGFYHYEFPINPNVSGITDVIYWGFSTVSTVGYGDIVPITTEGKAMAVIVMLLGVSFFLAFTSIWVTSFLTKLTFPKAKNGFELEIEELRERLTRIEKLIEKVAQR